MKLSALALSTVIALSLSQVEAFVPAGRAPLVCNKSRSHPVISPFRVVAGEGANDDDASSATTTTAAAVTPPFKEKPYPPGPKRKHIFRNIRDSFSYLKDSDRFMKTRTEKYGPVFWSYLFFRPTVFVGGPEAVSEFLSIEMKSQITRSTLPPTFEELHTEYGALNLQGEEHRKMRNIFNNIFNKKVIYENYVPMMEKELDAYLRGLRDIAKSKTIYLVPELRTFSLNFFSKMVTGKPLSRGQVQLFDNYNSGLLTASKRSKGFKEADQALKALTQDFLERFRECRQLKSAGETPLMNEVIFNAYSDAVEYEGFTEEQVATSWVLLVWGAYIEATALMVNSIITLDKAENKFDLVSRVLAEAGAKDEDWAKLQVALGAVRETLRVFPPSGGGFRDSPIDCEIAGYRIPAGTVITADPRISNFDPSVFNQPEKYEPLRWVIETNSRTPAQCPLKGTASNIGYASWFPGGIGAHQCPGVPLAETMATIWLVKFLQTFSAWEKNGDGLNKEMEVKQVLIPIRIPVDDFGLNLTASFWG